MDEHQQRSKYAAKKLGFPDDWIITYTSIVASHLFDESDVIEKLQHDDGDEMLCINGDEVCMALRDSILDIYLPENLFLLGLNHPDDTGGKNRRYGFVDFNGWEATDG